MILLPQPELTRQGYSFQNPTLAEAKAHLHELLDTRQVHIFLPILKLVLPAGDHLPLRGRSESV